MGSLDIYADVSAVVLQNNPTVSFAPETYCSGVNSGALLLGFENTYQDIQYKPFYSAYFYAFFTDWQSASDDGYIHFAALNEPIPSPVSYSNMPSSSDATYREITSSEMDSATPISFLIPHLNRDMVRYGLKVIPDPCYMYTGVGLHAPFLRLSWKDDEDDVGLTAQQLSPAAGTTIRAAEDTTFSWLFSPTSTGVTITPIVPVSTVFSYRAKGSSEIVDVILTDETEYTLPAGSINSDAIEWRVSVTSNSGYTYTTDWWGNTVIGLKIGDAAPSAGFVHKQKDNLFVWSLMHADGSGLVSQASGSFRWRYAGSTAYNTISVGSSNSVLIPAGTFEQDSVEWQIYASAVSGYDAISEWFSVSTVEPLSTAVPIQPKNAVVDGASAITFSWEHVISTGTEPVGFVLETSQDGINFITAESAVTNLSYVVIPANSFLAGDWYWRVRTYNTDEVLGEWSDIAHFVVIAAPPAPVITVVSADPRFSVRWEQTGQLAYELSIDGVVVSKRYTSESFYTHNDYLEPGEYTVAVRIQNVYGLWSEWGRAALPISNTDLASIVLSVKGDHEMTLSWTADSSISGFWVYRNGVKIAKTSAKPKLYVDKFAIGTVSYEVRGIFVDKGGYAMSNLVEANVSVGTLMIAAVDNPEWVLLPYSTSSLRSTGISVSHSVTYTHYLGQSLPDAEIGEATTQTYQLDCAWKVSEMQEAKKFENLSGKLVCIKTPSGRRIIGVMDNLQISENRFICSYSATITPVHWEEMSS